MCIICFMLKVWKYGLKTWKAITKLGKSCPNVALFSYFRQWKNAKSILVLLLFCPELLRFMILCFLHFSFYFLNGTISYITDHKRIRWRQKENCKEPPTPKLKFIWSRSWGNWRTTVFRKIFRIVWLKLWCIYWIETI